MKIVARMIAPGVCYTSGMTPTMKCLILFAAVVSAITAGKMVGNEFGDSLTSDFRELEAKQREEMQRFRDAEAVKLEQGRAEDERCLREIQKRIDATPGYAEMLRTRAQYRDDR